MLFFDLLCMLMFYFNNYIIIVYALWSAHSQYYVIYTVPY